MRIDDFFLPGCIYFQRKRYTPEEIEKIRKEREERESIRKLQEAYDRNHGWYGKDPHRDDPGLRPAGQVKLYSDSPEWSDAVIEHIGKEKKTSKKS